MQCTHLKTIVSHRTSCVHTGCLKSNKSPAMFLLFQAPKPGPYVKEMQDAAQFYTNRVLKDYKEK